MCNDLPLVVRSSRSAYRRLPDLTCKHAYANIQSGTMCRQATNSGNDRSTFDGGLGIELDEDCTERPAMYAAVLRLRLRRRSRRARTRRPVDRRRNRKCTCARIRNQNKRNANVPDHLCLRRSFAGSRATARRTKGCPATGTTALGRGDVLNESVDLSKLQRPRLDAPPVAEGDQQKASSSNTISTYTRRSSSFT